MATLNNALQSMVDNLHTKMISDEPMTAEEQTLIATAIDKLSDHADIEQAIIAVASEHLDNVIQNLSGIMSDAQSTLVQSLVSATAQLNTASTGLNQVNTLIENQQLTPVDLASVNNSTPRPLLALKHIENPGRSVDNMRSQSVFAVYDASGETYLVRPSYTASAAASAATNSSMLQFLRLAADGVQNTVLAAHQVKNNQFYAQPTNNIYLFGASAIVPLALRTDATDIQYDVVYSTQQSASNDASRYAGVYIRHAGADSITLPAKDIDATDQWGISTHHKHQWNHVSVLYDNQKHCLVIVDATTKQVTEKYRDVNLLTDIHINNNSELQAFVNSGDYTVITLISHQLAWPYASQLNSADIGPSDSSYCRDHFGFYGKFGDQQRMGGDRFCAHYCFTAENKLAPINVAFASAVSPAKALDANGALASEAEIHLVLSDFSNTTLACYRFVSKADHIAKATGYHGNSIMCVNPYSHVGILNEVTKPINSQSYYGIGRTCRAY